MIPSPHLLGILAIAWVVSLGLAGYTGYDYGSSSVEARWQAREVQVNAEHSAKLQAATERAREVERAANERYATVDASYQKRLQEVNRAKTAALDALGRAGRLSIPAECPSSGSAMPGTPAAASIGNGGARARLSDSAARFLVGLASEADAVVEQLRACQAVLAR